MGEVLKKERKKLTLDLSTELTRLSDSISKYKLQSLKRELLLLKTQQLQYSDIAANVREFERELNELRAEFESTTKQFDEEVPNLKIAANEAITSTNDELLQIKLDKKTGELIRDKTGQFIYDKTKPPKK